MTNVPQGPPDRSRKSSLPTRLRLRQDQAPLSRRGRSRREVFCAVISYLPGRIMEDLMDGWERRESRSKPGQAYYLHPESGQTQWEAPLKKKRRMDMVTREAPPLRPAGLFPTPAKSSGDSTSAASGAVGSNDSIGAAADDLFAGLPDANTDVCDPKRKETIAEALPKPVTHVKCLHILKKHTGSRRPSSWREKVVKRSEEEALHVLKELRKKLAACTKDEERNTLFGRLAMKESDCTSAHQSGSLGRFGRGVMQPSFEEVAFALAVNEMSSIVTTDSGLHIILRVE
eukprot:TRINITY_DN24912_c0_g1_i1.p1 TRINITY_DN24912_c0_g1~~TRINITY_DN24912_c0_g1_i1.p1  ORF type:complete len:294 (+),score=56.10 TRINITY_DN24912_c0_g1_i1:22-882(+)